MREITVSVVDANQSMHVKTHEGFADISLGALSAEPETIDELLAATHRYVEPKVTDFFMSFSRCGMAEDIESGEHVIMDLPARVLVNATREDEFHELGSITQCDEHKIYELMLPYRLPHDWLQTKDLANWQDLCQQRRQERARELKLDVRSVIYGKVAEYLVQEWRRCASKMQDPVAEIHDKWLLTPRDDLDGRTPREVLLAKRAFIDGDIEDQTELWTLLKRQPPGLSRQSAAYRFGGFGTHEVIFYHELVSLLLSECAYRLGQSQQIDLQAEVRHLNQLQQQWLHQPADDLYNQSPAAIIAQERSRLPAAIPKGNHMLDDDCPLCQMMAQEEHPAIWHLDNWLLCKRFATSFCDTLQQWQDEYGDWYSDDPPDDDFTFDGHHVTSILPLPDDSSWQSSFASSFANSKVIDGLPADHAISMLSLAIAGHLADLGWQLRLSENTEWLASSLQHHFAQLREAIQQKQIWRVNMATDNFSEQLRTVVEMDTDLRPKCQDLEFKLDQLADRCHRQFAAGHCPLPGQSTLPD